MQPLVEYPNTSPREFALGICANLRTQFGVDLAPILTSPALSERAKRRTAAQALAEAIIDRAHQQRFPDFVNDTTDPADDENIRRLLGSDRVADTIDTEPNFSVTERNAQILMTYEGDTLKTYVFNLTKRFENMANATGVGVLVAEMAAGAVVAVGVPAGVATVKALRAGQALLAAMRSGVLSIGIKTVITAVAAVLIALLLYLVFENPKRSSGSSSTTPIRTSWSTIGRPAATFTWSTARWPTSWRTIPTATSTRPWCN
ncbi:hypothetical protein [Plantactinospora sp. CA-290183]|uniref:hypothetical protein n=1 Tax=Plantactinospora sp. CA-290183 TaxID=3240006 RepID=UPI003D9244AA